MAPSLNNIAPFVGTGVELIKPGGGFVTGIDGVRLLYSADWTPSLGNDLDDPTYPSTYLWALNESSGTTLAESRVGGGTHDLLEGGGGGAYVGQVAAGIYDGSDLSSRKCLECATTAGATNKFQVASSALDPSNGSIAVRFRFRAPAATLIGGNGALMGTITGTSGSGWYIYKSGTNLAVYLRDSSGNGGLASINGLFDGAWHEIEMVIDWTADQLRVRYDGTAKTPVDISSVVQGDTAGAAFAIAGSNTLTITGPVQIERVLGWEASDGAESIDATAWTNVSKLGAKPAGVTLLDFKADYSGVLPVPCDAGSDGYWYLASGDKATDDYPIGYSANLLSYGLPNGFGYLVSEDFTNVVTESERLETTWTTTNATVSAAAANLIDNKLGFRMARKVTATGAAGYVAFSFTATATSIDACAWIAGNGGTVAGRLVLYDVTGAAELANTPFSVANGVLSPIEVNKFGGVTVSNTIELRIEITTNTEAVNVCHAVMHNGAQRHVKSGYPLVTFGATATIGTSVTICNVPNMRQVRGTYETGTVHLGDATGATDGGVFDLQSSGASLDRVALSVQTTEPVHRHHDSSGNPVGSTSYAFSPTVDEMVGYRIVYEWDSQNELAPGVYSRATVEDSSGANVTNMVAIPWTAGSHSDWFVRVGRYAGNTNLIQLLGYIRIWNKPGAL